MRFKVLDSWRGLAALMVAAYHFEANSHLYHISFFRNAFLFVDFFFVLSGFVIAHAYASEIGTARQGAAFMVRRFGRVYPLHFVVLAAFVAVEGLKLILSQGFGINTATPAFDPAGYTPLATLPGHIALTTSLGLHDTLTWNGPDWSISAEFWTYLVFALIVLATGRWRAIAMAAIGAIAALWLVTHARHGIDATYDHGFVRCVYGFMAGQVLYAARRHWHGLALPAASAVEFAALILVIAFVTIADRSALSYAAPFVFAAATFVFSYEQGAISRLLLRPAFQHLGETSYSIYMVHAFVWFVLGMAISVIGRASGVDPWQIVWGDGMSRRVLMFPSDGLLDLILLLYLALVLALAALTRRFVEDPGRRMFARLAGRIAEPRARPLGTAVGDGIKGL